jgi:hypothetical protein
MQLETCDLKHEATVIAWKPSTRQGVDGVCSKRLEADATNSPQSPKDPILYINYSILIAGVFTLSMLDVKLLIFFFIPSLEILNWNPGHR